MAKIMCPDCHHTANVDMCSGRCFCGHCGKEWGYDGHSVTKTRKAHVEMQFKTLVASVTVDLQGGDIRGWLDQIYDALLIFSDINYALQSITFFEEETHESF